MKRILDKYNHYKSVLHVLDKHKEVTADIPVLNQNIATLSNRVERIRQILHEISVPVSVLYAKKKNAERNMILATERFASLGILVASHKKDEVIRALMRLALSQLRKVSGFRMLHNALQVAGVLEANKALLPAYGVTDSILMEFRDQINAFRSETETLKVQLFRRKSMRRELASLIADTNKMLFISFDSVAEVLSKKHPDFYREYKLIRKPNPRKKRTVRKKDPATAVITAAEVKPVQTAPLKKPLVIEPEEPNPATVDVNNKEAIPESFLDELKNLEGRGIVFGGSEHNNHK